MVIHNGTHQQDKAQKRAVEPRLEGRIRKLSSALLKSLYGHGNGQYGQICGLP